MPSQVPDAATGNGCIRREKAAPTLSPEEKQKRIEELAGRFVNGARLLFEDGAGSCLDVASQALASHRGADLSRQLAALDFTISPRALAEAVAATSH